MFSTKKPNVELIRHKPSRLFVRRHAIWQAPALSETLPVIKSPEIPNCCDSIYFRKSKFFCFMTRRLDDWREEADNGREEADDSAESGEKPLQKTGVNRK